MDEEKRKVSKLVHIVILVLIVVCAVAQYFTVVNYNKRQHASFGGDSSKDVYMTIAPRGDNTSTWVKNNLISERQQVSVIGEIFDGVIVNNSSSTLASWTMRYYVTENCYLNQTWNGMLEIHQYVGTAQEMVQTLNLQQFDLKSIGLDYIYDGDLFIPLKSGDYFIYYPSERFKEVNLKPGESITIGMIFYHYEDFDLGAYRTEYFFHMDYTEGPWFILLVVLCVFWVFLIFLYYFSSFVYKKAQNDMRIEKAESENRAKSAFLANMSHEIRTPINTVLGLDTMILRESREDTIRAYAKDIRKAGNMLLELINGILDFSKLESGKIELVPSEYSLKELIGDVRCITSSKFADKDLEFIVEVDSTLPSGLYGDDVRIKQILVNLLTNAAKYTEKGTVWLKICGECEGDDMCRLSVAVKDTGMGIREEDIPKLAERFTRLDENRNRSIEGTGIGISLITGLLYMMDSELKIASVYGEGSEFSFEIRQRITDASPVGDIDTVEDVDSEDDFSTGFRAPNAQILVVDDNEMNLMVFENLLRETEIKIDKASSGRHALERTLEKKYDIIFMDHMMPGMDGIETFKAICEQENGQNCDTPEVILTANAIQEAKEEFLRQGFSAFVAKPIQSDLLEAAIMELLPDDKYTKCTKNAQGRSEKSALISIDGIDSAYALEHIGSTDGVIKAMKQFVNVADSEAEELMGYYAQLRDNPNDENALCNYRIKVHAMKTSAALVGGLMVYGAAAQLEYAARDGKVDEVLSISPYFVEFWNGLRDRLNDYFESTEEKEKQKTEIDEDKLKSLLHQLMTSMNAYDISSADSIVAELSSYGGVPQIAAILKDLKTAVANLDAPECTKLCETALR